MERGKGDVPACLEEVRRDQRRHRLEFTSEKGSSLLGVPTPPPFFFAANKN
jgi:hypothetical protein